MDLLKTKNCLQTKGNYQRTGDKNQIVGDGGGHLALFVLMKSKKLCEAMKIEYLSHEYEKNIFHIIGM